MFMKKMAAVLAAVTMFSGATAFAQDITIKLNGNVMELPVAAYAKDNRTMVPLRGVFEAVGATVLWEADGNEAWIAQEKADGLKVIVHPIGTNTAFVNEEQKTLDVASEVVNNYTMVPLRFIMENLGAVVEWDQENYTVNITTQAEEDTTAGEETAGDEVTDETVTDETVTDETVTDETVTDDAAAGDTTVADETTDGTEASDEAPADEEK